MYSITRWSWLWEMIGPQATPRSPPGPTRILGTASRTCSINGSWIADSTSTREPAVHTWPAFQNAAPFSAPFSARSKSASRKMMLGDLPPSSRETFFRLLAADRMISLPVSVPPVKATISTFALRASSAPTTGPSPATMLTMPLGISSMLSTTFMNSAVVPVVYSAGLMTTAQPAASAGATERIISARGMFQGTITPTTPTGSRSRMLRESGVGTAERPKIQRARPA